MILCPLKEEIGKGDGAKWNKEEKECYPKIWRPNNV